MSTLDRLVRTQDLFAFVVERPDKVERRRNPTDGTEFLVVWADDLRAAGYEVRQGGNSYDLTIRLRGGRAWNPADYLEDEDEDAGEVYGSWTDDDDTQCAYCAVGLAGSGEVCPACGTFQA